jgi:UDP-2,4-diacetamido-2,4,6-trideoxy-beta-L-altropyranose hydrolase
VKVLFRTNAGPLVGFGHLIRCRALAMAFRRKGNECIMVGPNPAYSKPFDHDLFVQWLHVTDWPSSKEDATQLISLAKHHQAQWLVLDDYRIDETYQLALLDAGLKWLQFDGTASKKLWADIIVNTNPIAKHEDYLTVLENPKSKLLLGPTYAILRPEFDNVQRRAPGRSVKKILVTFGGGDDRGAIEFVLSTLLPRTPLNQEFLVISGLENPNNPYLVHWIKMHGQGRVVLHIDPQHISMLFSYCDLAIMAGGTSIYEACVLGIPMVIMSIAENQVLHSKAWQKLGCLKYLGPIAQVEPSILLNSVLTISNNAFLRREMSISCANAVAGKGAELITALMTEST